MGKSSVTASLALAIARDPNLQVAILDVDLCGPSMPRMLGVEGETVHNSAKGWAPISVRKREMHRKNKAGKERMKERENDIRTQTEEN